MAKLFTKKQQLTKVTLDAGDVWLRPLPMRMVGNAQKLQESDNIVEQTVMFSTILKAVMVDEDGKPFEDVDKMTPDELGDMFSVADFTRIINGLFPHQEEDVGKD